MSSHRKVLQHNIASIFGPLVMGPERIKKTLLMNMASDTALVHYT